MSLILTVVAGFLIQATEFNTNQNYRFWLAQLKNSSVDIRINALEKLAEIKKLEAVPYIAQNALNSSEPEIRYHAARSLARLPSQDSLAFLGEQLRNEQDVYVKSEISRSIRSLKAYFEKIAPETPEETNDSESE